MLRYVQDYRLAWKAHSAIGVGEDNEREPASTDSQAMVVLMRPTLDSKAIFANSSAKSGVSRSFSLETFEQRGE